MPRASSTRPSGCCRRSRSRGGRCRRAAPERRRAPRRRPASQALEVSGGGCFRAPSRRAVESPWERIRAISSRARRRWHGAARAVPRRLPSGPPETRRRFMPCAAECGDRHLPAARPAERRRRPRGAADAVREAGAQLHAGLVYSAAGRRPTSWSSGPSTSRRSAPTGCCCTTRPAPSTLPAPASCRRVREAARRARRPLHPGRRRHGLAVAIEAARAGADPIATASYPVAMLTHRVPAELLAQALGGLKLDTGSTSRPPGRSPGSSSRTSARRRLAAAGLAERRPAGRARTRVPAGLVAGIERRLRRRRGRPGGRGARRAAPGPRRRRAAAAGLAGRADPGSQAIQHVLTRAAGSRSTWRCRRLAARRVRPPAGPVDAGRRALAASQRRPDTSRPTSLEAATRPASWRRPRRTSASSRCSARARCPLLETHARPARTARPATRPRWRTTPRRRAIRRLDADARRVQACTSSRSRTAAPAHAAQARARAGRAVRRRRAVAVARRPTPPRRGGAPADAPRPGREPDGGTFYRAPSPTTRRSSRRATRSRSGRRCASSRR